MRILTLAISPLLLAACAFQVESLDQLSDRPEDARDAPDRPQLGEAGDSLTDPQPDQLPAWDPSRHFVAAAGERFAGNMGSSRDLDLPSDLAFVYDDGWYTQLEVYARRADDTRVMLSLSISASNGQRWLVPGLGFKFRPGEVRGAGVWSLGCEGPASGATQMGMIFADTPYDEEPCEVAVDTEQDPEDPSALLVTMAATFADDCEDLPGDPGGGDGVELPDEDNDGDGDLPPPGEGGDAGEGSSGGGEIGAGEAGPLTATASFRLMQ